MNTTSVDAYLADGCGRCDKYQSPACKVHRWTDILVGLRALVRAAGLDEGLKWGSPTYTLDDKNVVMVTAFNDYASLSFFQGALLTDAEGLLESPGPNSQAVRQVRFTSMAELNARRDAVEALLAQAIAVMRSGARVELARTPEAPPEELQVLLDADPALAAAFAALTPGRRRSHALHVNGAKQASARRARAGKCAEKIRVGQGFNER